MSYGQGNPDFVYLPHWRYLGGETITGNAASQAATLPVGTQIFEIDAEGGDVQYDMNAVAANPGPGFVPENGARIQGPLANLASLNVYAAVGVIIHILYYAEHVRRR